MTAPAAPPRPAADGVRLENAAQPDLSPRPARSLQARLLWTVLGLLVLVWCVTTLVTWYDTQRDLGELLDAHLEQTAALLAAGDLDDDDDSQGLGQLLGASGQARRYATRVDFQLWHKGQLVARSEGAPAAPLAAAQPGLSDQQVDGQPWRVATHVQLRHGRVRDVVHVGQPAAVRQHLLLRSLLQTLWPLLLALPVLALGIWWAVRQTLKPLRLLGQQVAARQPQSLQPLPVQGVPPEAQPLVAALNGLFARMADLLESERRFTADAAHELRTPIAAIRMQAQVAQGAAHDAERQQALAATVQGCDRATRLVEQLLQLARLEAQADAAAPAAPSTSSDAAPANTAPASGPPPSASTDITRVAQAVLADLEPQARSQGQSVSLDAPDAPLPVPTAAPLVQVLLRNLVDNALRYSPPGAQVQVQLQATPQVQLVVQDSGPGLDDAALARLGERFFRVLGTGQSGSGLGWSIVQRIARTESLHITVDRSPSLGGLRVRIGWR